MQYVSSGQNEYVMRANSNHWQSALQCSTEALQHLQLMKGGPALLLSLRFSEEVYSCERGCMYCDLS
jgi:hypothetical protein